MYVFSIVLVVASNIIYHISQKSVPEKANPFLVLLFTYLSAAVVCVIAAMVYKTDKGLLESLKDLNWTSLVLGIAIVGLELGFLMAYRSGWNISTGSLVANIIVALMLIPIGILFFKEGFDTGKLLGSVLCIIGLILINR